MGWNTIIVSDRSIPQELVDRIATQLPRYLAGERTRTALGWQLRCMVHNPLYNELKISGDWWTADQGPSFTHVIVGLLQDEGHQARIKRSDLIETRHAHHSPRQVRMA